MANKCRKKNLFKSLYYAIPTLFISICSSSAYADTITVNAAGSLAGNIGPIMDVKINGKVIATQEVRNTTAQDYNYTVPTLAVGTKLDVVFTNDAFIKGNNGVQEDRNLIIKYVKHNGTNLAISSAVYDQGAGAGAFDGIGIRSIAGTLPYPYIMYWSGALRFVLTSGMNANQMGLVINDNDPYSREIGEYYRVKRQIPMSNIVHLTMPVVTSLTAAQFATVKLIIDSLLPSYVQGIALAWEKPYAVDCNSITSAVTMGFQKDACNPNSVGIVNPYYNSLSPLPFTQKGMRPSMLLAAKDVAGAKALIDRGLASNHTAPTGSAYIMNTSDNIRSLRVRYFPTDYLGKILSPYVNVAILNREYLSNYPDVMFYFQGLAKVPGLTTNTYFPGAVADTVTSYSGALDNPLGQMSILEFISAGATGSYGTVVEPLADPAKFPEPMVMIRHYTSGETLLESYWKSVKNPFQGLFIGDPLANPWEGHEPRYRDNIKPTVPSPLIGYFVPNSPDSSSPYIAVYWNTSVDDNQVVGYKIYKNGVFYKQVNNTYLQDINIVINPATTYTYSVTAVDAAGNESAKSNVVSVTTNNNPSPPGCDSAGVKCPPPCSGDICP